MSNGNTWFTGQIVRSQIPKAAVKKFKRKDGSSDVAVDFVISRLREPDDYGNTHTIYFKEEGSDEKYYFGKAKERFSGAEKAQEGTGLIDTDADDDSLPF